MELHKSYIVLGLIIAFLLFFGIAAYADEAPSNPKTQMLSTHQDRASMQLLSFDAARNEYGTRK